MIPILCGLLLLTHPYPFWRAWLANRHTTLRWTLVWTFMAWLCWLVVVGGGAIWPSCDGPTSRYLALTLTGCAGVAVLGARKPVVTAWNFVLTGLAAVLLLPVAEGFGTPRLSTMYLAFLIATLAVGFLNYLPTPLAPAVLSLAAACTFEIVRLANGDLPDYFVWMGRGLLGLTPWLTFLMLSWRGKGTTEFDQTWLAFRDRFGVVWSQRTREQFNRAAVNAGLPWQLSWQGLQCTVPDAAHDPAQALETLKALLIRFEERESL